MRFIPLLISWLVPFLIASTALTAGARDTLLYEAPIQKVDYVAGTLEWVRGRDAGIDMGYVEGVVPGHRFRVYRRRAGDHQLVGVMLVDAVQRRRSIGTLTTRFAIRPGDAVVIVASELVIWSPPTTRQRDERLRRDIASRRGLVIDARDQKFDAIDRLERRRSNRLPLMEFTKRLKQARPNGAALWDLTRLKTRRVKFVKDLENFGASFRYRSVEVREQTSFVNVVQPIGRAGPAGYEEPVATPPPEAAVGSPAASDPDSDPDSATVVAADLEPPSERIFSLARQVSEYLKRSSAR